MPFRNPSKRPDACVGCDEASFGGGDLGSISIDDDDEDDIDSAVEP